MGIIVRGALNVTRNPLRLVLVVLLLGASLMFVAAMISLNTSAQQQLQTVRKDVGTGITINLASNSQQAGPDVNANGNTNGNGNGNGNRFGNGNGGNGGFNLNQTRDPIPNSTVDKVKKVAGVASVEENLRRIDTSGTLKTGTVQTPDGNTRTMPLIINGISNGATHFTLTGGTPTMVDGRGFQDSDANANVTIMSKTLADTNSLKVGSTLTLQGTTFTVIGLYTSEQFSDSSLTIPLATMQRVFKVDGVDSITAYAESYDQVDALAAKLRSVLGNQYSVTTENRFYQNAFNALNVAQNSIQMALIVSIATACIVIIFAVFMIVRERTTEIGTLKAIGASHWQVINQFWVEVLTLSVLAAVVAAALLATLGPVVSQNFDVSLGTGNAANFAGRGGGNFRPVFVNRAAELHLTSATLNLQTLAIILGLGILLAVLTSAIPAWYVARIKPAEVLRKGV